MDPSRRRVSNQNAVSIVAFATDILRQEFLPGDGQVTDACIGHKNAQQNPQNHFYVFHTFNIG